MLSGISWENMGIQKHSKNTEHSSELVLVSSDGSKNKSIKMDSGLSLDENFTTFFAPLFLIQQVHTRCLERDFGSPIYLAHLSGLSQFFLLESSQQKIMKSFFNTSTMYYLEQLLLGLLFICGETKLNNFFFPKSIKIVL